MAQTIKLKRSAVSGNTPSTSDLELGEIAINTYDGKVFIKKDDGSASVIEVGAADNTKLPLAGGTMTGALNMGGNSITSDTNLTLNVVGSINLDADTNGSIFLKDDGLTYGRLYRSGTPNHFNIKSTVNNADILLQGKDNSGTEITALTLDMSDAGAAIFNSRVTLGGNLLHAGNFTLDVAGDIALDAGGGDIRLRDDGVLYGNLSSENGDLNIKSPTADKDIKFVGNDDGSNITALTLDMSNAGAAIFNDQITLGGNLVHAGNFTIDSGGDITLDADGADVILKDAGTEFGRFSRVTSDFVIKSATSDKDIIFKGVDDGSTITALTLDMSEGGHATFANNVTISGNLEVTGTTTQTGSIITNSNFTGLSDANSANATDFGFYGKYVESSTTKYAGMYYDASTDNTFKLFCDTQTAPTTTVNESATGYALANLNIAGLTALGNVGIGTSSPARQVHLHDTSGDNNLHITNSTTGATASDGFSVVSQSGTNDVILNQRETANLIIHTANTERVRIDSSGNVLIGTVDSTVYNNSTGAGVVLGLDNSIQVARADDVPLLVNRQTSDGGIANFYKDGSLIGSIGAAAGRMYIHNNYGGGAGLRFDNASIRPATSTGVGENGTTDLGSTGVRFKDLYLSGSANIGTNILMSNASTSGFMQVSTNILQFGTSSNDPLAIFTNNSEQIRIDTDGRLLLNTTSSIDNLSQLHIVGFTSGRAGITLQDGDSTTQKTFLTQSSGTTRFNTQNGTSYGSFQIGGWNGTTSADFVRVTEDGRVGIGTTAPETLLHVRHGTDASAAVVINGGHNARRLKIQSFESNSMPGAGFIFNADSSGGAFKFQTTSTTRLIINHLGNLGIGTESPDSKVTIYNAATGITGLVKLWTNTSNNTAADGGAIEWVGSGDKTAIGSKIAATRVASGGKMDLRFYTGRDSDSDHEKMRILTDGKVGIGTASPANLLHLRGGAATLEIDSSTNTANLDFDNNSTTARIGLANDDLSVLLGGTNRMRLNSSGNLGIGTVTPTTAKLVVQGADSSDVLHLHGLTGTNTRGLKISLSGEGATNQVVNYDSMQANGIHVFKTAGTERMRIHDGGNVGIGTTPTGAKLHVAGGVKATDLIAHDSTGINLQTDEGTKRLVVADSGVITFNQAYSFPTSDGSTGQALITDGSGNITFGSVSAGAASSMVDADGDTKIQVEETSDDDVIRFDTAGSERMIITDDGKVGINNDSPSKTLSVGGTFQSTGEAFFSHFDNTTSSSRMRDNLRLNFGTTRTFAILGNSTNMHIRNSNTDVMTFDTSNRVGIGNTSPGTPLHVGGTIRSQAQGSSAFADYKNQQLYVNTGSYTIAVNGKIHLADQNNNEVLTVDNANDRVGIGTTDPLAPLHLKGTGDTTLIVEADSDNSGETDNARIELRQDGNNVAGYLYTEGNAGQTATGTIANTTVLESKGGGNDVGIHFATGGRAPAQSGGELAGTVRMTILGNGNVGIGTSSPSSSLDVIGELNVGVASDRLRLNSSTATAIVESNSSDSLILRAKESGAGISFQTGGTSQRMKLTSDGKLGIGTNSPSYKLTIAEGNSDIGLVPDGANGSYIRTGGSDTNSGVLRFLRTGNVESMRIDSSGNVGIGTNSPSAILETVSATNGGAPVFRAGTADFLGAVIGTVGGGFAVESGNYFSIWHQPYANRGTQTNLTERLRIDTSGNVMVGKTATGLGNQGAELSATGQLKGTAANQVVAYLNRTSSDGTIAEFRKENSTVGSIGTTASGLVVGNGDTALFFDAAEDSVKPRNSTGAARDAAIDLGKSIHRFRHLYLSGDLALTNSFVFGNTNGLNLRANSSKVISMQIAGSERARLDSAGNFGIGTSTPAFRLHSYHPTTNVVGRFESGDSQVWIDLHDSNSGTYGALLGHDTNAGQLFMVADQGVTRRFIIDTAGQVSIGTSVNPVARLQVEELGIDTTTTSTTATTQVAIDTFAAATFRSAKYTVQVTNSTDSTYHVTEILLIHDGTTPAITEYGTIFTGSAEATFDADISSGNVRLLATPATTDSMTFKVVRHCITV